MTEPAFTTELLERDHLLVGPWRSPKQMLHAQVYDSHASIHDDATAQKLGFQGGTIEGPTHFSQFAPLLVYATFVGSRLRSRAAELLFGAAIVLGSLAVLTLYARL